MNKEGPRHNILHVVDAGDGFGNEVVEGDSPGIILTQIPSGHQDGYDGRIHLPNSSGDPVTRDPRQAEVDQGDVEPASCIRSIAF